MIPNMDLLGGLIMRMHDSLSHLFYLMMPVAILLSVIIGYLKSGSSDFPDVVKRCLVASLLLVSFPWVSNAILDLGNGLAAQISNMQGLNTFMQMAQEKSREYATAKSVILLKFDDLFIAVLSFCSFILLYFSRYVTIALYVFYWVLLCILSPLMILCYVFPQTAKITGNLYKGLIEVASWKCLWAIMSAMLTSLSFGTMYKSEGSYASLIVLNFVISIALLFTPLIARSLINQGIQATAGTIGGAAALAMVSLPAKIATVARSSREVVSNTSTYAAAKMTAARNTFNPNNRR